MRKPIYPESNRLRSLRAHYGYIAAIAAVLAVAPSYKAQDNPCVAWTGPVSPPLNSGTFEYQVCDTSCNLVSGKCEVLTYVPNDLTPTICFGGTQDTGQQCDPESVKVAITGKTGSPFCRPVGEGGGCNQGCENWRNLPPNTSTDVEQDTTDSCGGGSGGDTDGDGDDD